ncbi:MULTISPECIES: energy transducer TonB [Xanthomonas]|uniref:TonB family protein n=1 Tax=Xanthomonas rydalmerensis TaxID=3046274 RepID=A0ABZ0JK66_9XANT|nr:MULTISPECIES: energy transducer TonB [unclassified Xanthomonas]MBB5940969.1 protein TonB [Xanthomonas sp. 3307]WOS39607.1 TonB family protein [Xanthomonas sp. DM-2023]WOS43791.1 TonB family protein [Xanthomonas sp. DM-2023]WOS47971.1 TonB family protein [Xanthomonas sp. DM-2023]WOS52150.1 TonB family protein [Xanthomonas sp. DM-2023]
MVRTQLPAPSFRIDLSRVLAYSTALALHLLAALLLLLPLSHVTAPPEPAQVQPRWQQPVVVPVTPPPTMPVTEKQTPPQPRTPTAVPVPVPVPTPTPVDSSPVALDTAPSVDPAPSIAAPSLPPASVSAPVEGMQLQYLRAPAPPYPRDGLRDRLQGSVLLRVLVGTDGQPLQVSVEKSSGHRVLDQAARDQVLKRWAFKPALQNGTPVQAYGLVPIDFSLDR